MINFKITGLESGLITIEKPSGKEISLKLGEILRADVMEILPSGVATLKIKGDLITAKTEIPLEKGTTAFLKVAGEPGQGKDLRLQFVGYTDEAAPGQPSGDLKGDAVSKLIQELSFLKNQAGSGENFVPEKFSMEKLENLIKALPPDINSLPKEVKAQVQEFLTTSLKSAGQSIQTRLDDLISQLPDAIKNQPLVENLKKELTVNVEKLLGASLKNALQNTGVVLEAKLKSVAAGELLQQMEQGVGNPETAAGTEILKEDANALEAGLKSVVVSGLAQETEDSAVDTGTIQKQAVPGSPPEQAAKEAGKSGLTKSGHLLQEPGTAQAGKVHQEMSAVKNDLKAALLELKQFVSEKTEDVSANLPARATAAASHGIQDNLQSRNLQGTIDGLLKDIETFQALSKTTDSFYTFLPLNWKELKDGDISFKRGRTEAEGKSSCSCRINLDLAEFGNLSVMVIMHNGAFFVSFKPEQPELKSALNANLDQLKDAFMEKGLNLKAVNTVDKEDNSFEQLEKLESSERIISIKA